MLDDIGNHFLDHALELVKAGKKFVYVVDNIDWEEKVHDMRSSHQNRSVHAVATSMVFSRVLSDHLHDNGPQHNVKTFDFKELVHMSHEEMNKIKDRYRVLAAKILLEKFQMFSNARSFMSVITDCEYADLSCENKIEIEIITLPVLLKDEKKYSDCVIILDQLEEWTHKLYEASGLSEKESSSPSTPLIGDHANPDQPRAPVPPTALEDDPLSGVRIPCFGDKLTRLRFAGSRDLRSGAHSGKQCLDHLYPYHIVGWHKKRSYLKVLL